MSTAFKSVFKAASSMIFKQSQAPGGTGEKKKNKKDRERERARQTHHLTAETRCALFALNLILVSGVCTTPPAENVRLKRFAGAGGWSTLGRKGDSTALDCFLSQQKKGSVLYGFNLQDCYILAVQLFFTL